MNTPNDDSTFHLNRKHGTLFYASRGTAIVSTQGNILITAADPCLASRAFIIEGECHLLQRSGWIRLQASGAETAAGLVITPTGNRLTTWWQRWLQRARRPLPLRS